MNQAGSSKSHRGNWVEDYASILNVLNMIVDIVAVIGAALIAHLIIFGNVNLTVAYNVALLFSALLTSIVFRLSGLYEGWRGLNYMDHVRVAVFAWIITFILLTLTAFLLKVGATYSRLWAGTWGITGLVLIIGARGLMVYALRALHRHGHNHKRVVVIGAGPWGQRVAGRLKRAQWLGLDVVGFLDHDASFHGKVFDGIPVKGGYDVLARMVAEGEVDDVWICLPLRSSRTPTADYIRQVMDLLRSSTVTQRLVPDLEEMRIINQPVTEIVGLPVVNLNMSRMHGMNRVVKALEDRVLALMILLLISPLALLIALAIRLDSPGPVLFRQIRHGWDGQPITVYKFRTMKVHDEETGKVSQATRDDERLTRIGRFLRRTSLDELPQFVNVLQGNMSIVGPRPHAIEHNEYYMDQIEAYMQRHRVKPGITGWAQVNGFRGETETLDKMRERVNMDLYYIENWSLWFDLKIIARTMLTGFVNENAY